MKSTLALITVLLVLQNRSVSANVNALEFVSNLFDATFNPTGFSVEVVISAPLSAHEACANELNSSIRKDIADAGADIRQALRIQQTVPQENFEKLSRPKKELVANIKKCVAQNEDYICHFSAWQQAIRKIQVLNHNHIPVDHVKIFFRLVKLCKSLAEEFAKYNVCLLEDPEVTSSLKPQASSESPAYSLSTESESTASSLSTEKGSSDSSEAEETTASSSILPQTSSKPTASSLSTEKGSSNSSEANETTSSSLILPQTSSESPASSLSTEKGSSDSSGREETTASSSILPQTSSESTASSQSTENESSDSSGREETTTSSSILSQII